MSVTRLARIVGTTGVIVATPLLVVAAQSQSPPPSPTSPPAATKTETSTPPTAPQATPSTPSEKAAAPSAADQLVGLTAKSSDGTNLGSVQAVIIEPNGKTAIGVKVGSFLGFGGHIVAIPDGKFNRVGDTVQISMTADEVKKLPKAKTQK
jgi:sporulation protein YlmC with PRC-barrel domain